MEPKRTRSAHRTTPRPRYAPDLTTDLRERLLMSAAHLVNATALFNRTVAALPDTDEGRATRREIACAAVHVTACLDIARHLSRKPVQS